MKDTNTPSGSRPRTSRRAMVLLPALGTTLGLMMAWLMTGWGGRNTAAESLLLTPIPERVGVGAAAPDFEGRAATGKVIRLSALRGSPVAINFWATWCAPCKLEMPELESAAKRHTDIGLVILGVNSGEDASQVMDFYRELNLTFDSVLDPNLKIVDLYEIRAFPTTIFVDRAGIVRAKHLGGLTGRDIDRYVSDLIAAR